MIRTPGSDSIKETLIYSLPVIANVVKQSSILYKPMCYGSPRRYAPRDDEMKQRFLKVKGNIHWVSVAHAYECEVRLYDRLFKEAQPGNSIGGSDDRDFLEDINQNSVQVITAQLEQSLQDAKPEESFQFERHGYFVADRTDSVAGKPVFNRTVTLRDAWQK